MIPIGTLVNIATVLTGGLVGLLFQRFISSKINEKIFFIMGLFTIFLGLSMSIKSTDLIIMLLSIVLGTMLGEYFNLDDKITLCTDRFKKKININSDQFTDGILTSFLLFCIGSMTIVGSIEEGLGLPPDILYTKSIMDGVSAIILASTFGIGVLFSVFPMLLFQGGITLLVFYFKDFFPLDLITHISSVGGVLIIAIGFKILGYQKITPINMLPSLMFVVIIYMLKF